MAWETVIGLEVHVQLRTRSKMFCSCSFVFGDPPNTHVCPVCLGLPGALPVPNIAAVRLGVRTALALDCVVYNASRFERKSYFYPDLPKGYQISQFQHPLAASGALTIAADAGSRRIGVNRLHLEEDAGKSLHDRIPAKTALDFNRSGVPLAEIVSEPDLRSPEEARGYLVSLKQLLQYLDVSDCNMEEGSLRVDANLSVRRPGEPLGTKQELKNLNSFASVVRGLALLRDEQIERLEGGCPVEMKTYMLESGQLRVMRTKEECHDYRYFPDPDLPPLVLDASGIDVDVERASLPELPSDRCARFAGALGLPKYEAEVLTSTPGLADYFEAVLVQQADVAEVSHWVMESVLANVKEHGGDFRVSPDRLAALIDIMNEGTVSRRAAKVVFAAIAEEDEEPSGVAARLGLTQIGDAEQLVVWVDSVLESNPDQVARYCAGETKLLGFFMGRVMDVSGGQAHPTKLRVLLERRLRERRA